MKGPHNAKTVRLVAVLVLMMLAMVPFASGYLNPEVNMAEYALEKTCYCHGELPVDNVTIFIDVPDQVAWTPRNESVTVTIGILGKPENLTGFGLYLNASEDETNVKWNKDIANDSGPLPDVGDKISVDGPTMWTVGPLHEKWYNLSFVPGNEDQTITLSVTGMRANGNNNESNDYWNVAEQVIEVREQRLMQLNVTISNLQPIAVNEPTPGASAFLVDFYVDDEYIGNSSVEEVLHNDKANVSIDWDVTFKEDGEYTLRAVIDPQGAITELDRSNNEITREIWLGDPPEEENLLQVYYGIGSVIVGVVIIVVLFWYIRRRQYRF